MALLSKFLYEFEGNNTYISQENTALVGLLIKYSSTQGCILLTYLSVISSKFIQKFAQKCQYFTLIDQSVPLYNFYITFYLRTNQLWVHQKTLNYLLPPRFSEIPPALIMKCHHRSLAINQETDNFQSETEEKKRFILIFLSRINLNIEDSMRFIVSSTDYGRAMKPFFMGLCRQFDQIILGHLV